MAMAPFSPTLLLPQLLHYLPIHSFYKFLRLFAKVMAPYSPMLLLADSLNLLPMLNIMRP
jgi:hypothetical protein